MRLRARTSSSTRPDPTTPMAALAAGRAGGEASDADPYRLARAAIAAGVHYLDLADEPDFCAGISALDGAARAAGVCVLSGVSTVPALSSAAVAALAGEDRVEAIDGAILPGNRAPRGLSVMHSILEQAGRPLAIRRAGRAERRFGWSHPASYALPGGSSRQGYLVNVPDLALFPDHFGAPNVCFRAGLELAVMRHGLAVFAGLRRLVPFPVPGGLVRLFHLAAGLLAPFGTARGGMAVIVTTAKARRSWRLLAQDGDGPSIPAVPVRALLRRGTLPVGAAPAVGILTLAEAEAAMEGLSVTTERVDEPLEHLFERVLGTAFQDLPEPVRESHRTPACRRFTGRAEVTPGTGWWPALIAAPFGFPREAGVVEVEVVKEATARGETWERRFARADETRAEGRRAEGRRAEGRRTWRFRSHLQARDSRMSERFGPFTFTLGLAVRDGGLEFPVLAGRLGPLPLPRALLPVSVARESADPDGPGFRFDVAIHAPLTGALVVRYRGALVPE